MDRPEAAAVTRTVLTIVLVALGAESYPRMRERIASYFAARGKPDGWTSRPAYAAFVLLGAALLAVLCPWCMRRGFP